MLDDIAVCGTHGAWSVTGGENMWKVARRIGEQEEDRCGISFLVCIGGCEEGYLRYLAEWKYWESD